MYRDIEEESPTDTSEDSVEVGIKPIKKSLTMQASTPASAGKKNKRKSMEPKRLATVETPVEPVKRCRLNSTGSEDRSPPVSYNSESRSPSPISPDSKSESSPGSKRSSLSPMCLAPKKRFKFDALRDLEQLNSDKQSKHKSEHDADDSKDNGKSPFRPWSGDSDSKVVPPVPGAAGLPGAMPPYIPFLLPGLIAGSPDKRAAPHPLLASLPGLDPRLYSSLLPHPYNLPLQQQPGKPDPSLTPSPTPPQEEPLSLVVKKKSDSESSRPAQFKPSPIKSANNRPPAFNVEALMNAQKAALSSTLLQKQAAAAGVTASSPVKTSPVSSSRARHDSGSGSSCAGDITGDKNKQRNYKNMTRERRVEANARERQRVHTITAAFDTLQAAIPTKEKDIKLSKLSVIKIATAYIMALSRMAGHDYTEDQSAPPVDEVIKHCSDVIEQECRTKKRNGSP